VRTQTRRVKVTLTDIQWASAFIWRLIALGRSMDIIFILESWRGKVSRRKWPSRRKSERVINGIGTAWFRKTIVPQGISWWLPSRLPRFFASSTGPLLGWIFISFLLKPRSQFLDHVHFK
jgi:hypothetical protein